MTDLSSAVPSATPAKHPGAAEAAGPAADQPALVRPATSPASVQPASPARMNLTLAVVALSALIMSMASAILVPVLPTLPVTLHTSPTNVEWLLTVTSLVTR